MTFRKLRITWSVAWGLVAVSLVMLWVRSYRVADILSGNISTTTAGSLTSDKGRLLLSIDTAAPTLPSPAPWHMTYAPGPAKGKLWTSGKLPAPSAGWYVKAPYGLFVFLVVALAAGPWFRRFSLRTLLIATTLVAVMMGMLVYALK